jgi:hypothetical protein
MQEKRTTPVSTTTLKDWQNRQKADPAFVAAADTFEIGYQIACLRIQRGLKVDFHKQY